MILFLGPDAAGKGDVREQTHGFGKKMGGTSSKEGAKHVTKGLFIIILVLFKFFLSREGRQISTAWCSLLFVYFEG